MHMLVQEKVGGGSGRRHRTCRGERRGHRVPTLPVFRGDSEDFVVQLRHDILLQPFPCRPQLRFIAAWGEKGGKVLTSDAPLCNGGFKTLIKEKSGIRG